MSAVPDRMDAAARLEAQFAATDHAYQPIINTSTLRVHGFEALARPAQGAGGICTLLDAAADLGIVRPMEKMLLRRAIGKFARVPDMGGVRLFCNVDNRSYDGHPITEETMREIVFNSGLNPDSLCLEISERLPVLSSANLQRAIGMLTGLNVRIALDDFGVGMSGLHMLMTVEPHYVKIDRSFIADLPSNARKQAIVAKLCGLAHALGFLTVAEGVETEAEFRSARDLGCDLAQGYHIARPTTDLRDLSLVYAGTLRTVAVTAMAPRVAELLTPVTPLTIDEPLLAAANVFKAAPDLRILPVTDRAGTVLGAVLEEDVRRYLLSDFGPALLANKGAAPRLDKLVRRVPIGEAHGSVEAIVNSYVAAESAGGLILATEGRYVGYLSNHAVLRLASEREVSAAREQNPLTQLAGNRSIARHIEESLSRGGAQTLAFLDFDNFKAFNDTYGFAAGDRALLMFGDLLRKLDGADGTFVGHIGGDDFFISLERNEAEATVAIAELCAKFASDAESLYSPADRGRGGIVSTDRFGLDRFFPLLRVSASLLHLPEARAHLTAEMVNMQLSAGKQAAKAAVDGLSIRRLPETGRPDTMQALRRAAA
ncbi:EAL domain-containing protein [Sphingomonas profundi]|uniref:EAL domain-containing protein n=1 Tax=Alterirhizorhabdus profundi TaxID=2681549 RepID=UPI0012E9023C|nr:EAL domain-containing protein [Sphingomonas profundi]